MYSISLKCAIGMCMECAIDDIKTWPNRYIVFRGAGFFIRSHVYHLKEHAGMIISRYMVNTMSIEEFYTSLIIYRYIFVGLSMA